MADDPTQANYKAEVERAKADCLAAGLSLVGPCGAIRITNLVAWRLGYKLLGKTAGNRACLRPDMSCVTEGEPGFADGYIIHLPTGYGADILGDAGNTNAPAWQPETTKVDRNKRDYKEPLFDPLLMSGEPPTPPEPPEPPTEPGDLEQRVKTLEAAVMVLAGKHDNLERTVDVNHERMEAIDAHWAEADKQNVKKGDGSPVLPHVHGGRIGGFISFQTGGPEPMPTRNPPSDA